MTRRAPVALLASVCLAAAGARASAAAPAIDFKALPARIDPGGAALLSWTVSGATSCQLAGLPAELPSGSRQVTPAATTTYALDCGGPGGPAVAYATVDVNPPVTIAKFVARPETIPQGGSAQLEWEALRSPGCTLEPGFGSVSSSGTRDARPTHDQAYVLSCRGPGGPARQVLSVKVALPAEIFISAHPQRLACGEAPAVAWQTAHAVSCRMSPGAVAVALDGDMRPALCRSTTFELTCLDAVGRPTLRSAAVEVDGECGCPAATGP